MVVVLNQMLITSAVHTRVTLHFSKTLNKKKFLAVSATTGIVRTLIQKSVGTVRRIIIFSLRDEPGYRQTVNPYHVLSCRSTTF